MADYVHIQVKPKTKERFLELGKMSDTQDSVLSRLLDFYEQAEEMKAFWEKYHDYEEQIECDMEQHGIFIGKFEGE